jgi:hypothetical protein
LQFAIRSQFVVERFQEVGWRGEEGVEVEVWHGDGRWLTIRSQLGSLGRRGWRRFSRLEAAELVDASMKDAGGGGAGSFDGAAEFVGGFVEVGEAGVGGVAAAETPGGSGDFGDEGFFEERGGAELVVHGSAEFYVDVALVGFYVVGSGVEAEGEGVA